MLTFANSIKTQVIAEAHENVFFGLLIIAVLDRLHFWPDQPIDLLPTISSVTASNWLNISDPGNQQWLGLG